MFKLAQFFVAIVAIYIVRTVNLGKMERIEKGGTKIYLCAWSEMGCNGWRYLSKCRRGKAVGRGGLGGKGTFMKHPFIKLIIAALFTLATASVRAEAAAQEMGASVSIPAGTVLRLGTPITLSLSTTGFLTDSGSEAFAMSSGFSSLDDVGVYSLGGPRSFAANAFGSAPNFSLSGPGVSVPLPEPSSETALYFLSGAVGLALVVMRRRTLA